jgi:hypothetical protein
MTIEIDNPEVVAEVTEAHEQYERALNSNDLDALDRLFWDDPRTLRYGPNGTLVGHRAISAFRRARPGAMPPRMSRGFSVTTFGRDFAVTHQESGRPDGQTTRQSQTWIRTADGWRIVSAHVSDFPVKNTQPAGRV